MRPLFLAVNVLVIGGIAALMIAALVFEGPQEYLRSLMGENVPLTMGALALLSFVATVIAPVTTILLVPTAAGFIGPIYAGIAAWFGWFSGSLVAFALARHVGKPLLIRFFTEEKISLYERYVPEKFGFWALVLLRMVISPDVLSYAVGLFSRFRWRPYIAATALGLIPFSFISAFVGDALFSGNHALLLALLALGVILYVIVVRYVLKNYRGIR